MSDTTTARLLAIHNAAAEIIEDENPVKKFSDKKTTEARTAAILEKLTRKQGICRPAKETVLEFRDASILGLLGGMIDTDEGADEADLLAKTVEYYTEREKTLKDPMKKVRGVLNRLHRSKGIGFCRVGSRYWLVS